MTPQLEIIEHYARNGWAFWTPEQIGLQIAEEAGEVCKAINHTDGAKKRKPLEEGHSLEEEMGQLCYALICLCTVKGLDFQKIVENGVAYSHTPAKEKHYGKPTQ